MDFVGAILNEIFDVSWYWWLVVFVLMTGMWISQKNIEFKRRMINALFMGYVFLVLIITLFDRNFTQSAAELELFWSYGRPKLVNEIILNYFLFIPIGVLLEFYIGGKHFAKNILRIETFVIAMSLSIETCQLIFNRGLFEFDEIVLEC